MLSTSDLKILLKRGFSQMPEILCVLLEIVRGKKSEEFGSVSFNALSSLLGNKKCTKNIIHYLLNDFLLLIKTIEQTSLHLEHKIYSGYSASQKY